MTLVNLGFLQGLLVILFDFLFFNFGCYMTVATTIGTVVAFLMVPMRSLGQDSWKIAAALMGRHIGGGNFQGNITIQNTSCVLKTIS